MSTSSEVDAGLSPTSESALSISSTSARITSSIRGGWLSGEPSIATRAGLVRMAIPQSSTTQELGFQRQNHERSIPQGGLQMNFGSNSSTPCMGLLGHDRCEKISRVGERYDSFL